MVSSPSSLRYFPSFFTRSLGMGLAPICSRRCLFLELIFLFPTSADGRRGLFPLWDSSQSFGFYLLPSPVRQFVRATICPCTPFFTHPVTKYKHLLAFTLTQFFTFSDRPWGIDIYYYLVLMVILWRLANSNMRDSRNSLFLFSQWETTWQY